MKTPRFVRYVALTLCSLPGLLGIFAGLMPASAVTCNDPSGFLKTFGTITLGDTLILGPGCQQVQDGGPAGVGTVSSVGSGTGLTGGPITGAGTLSFAAIAADSIWLNGTAGIAVPTVTALPSCSAAASALTYNTTTHAIGCNSISGAGGSVTSVATGTGLTGGTITTSGTISLAAIAADALLMNSTGGSAAPIATAVGSCSGAANALLYNTGTHAFGCNTLVNSIAGNTGAFTLSTGLTNSGNALSIDKATSANLEAGTSNKVLTADIIYDGQVTISPAASLTLDFSTFLNGQVVLNVNVTTLTCSNIKASQSGVITIAQDATGSRTMVAAWCSAFRWAGGTRGVLSTAANAIDALFYQCTTTAICYVSLSKAQAN